MDTISLHKLSTLIPFPFLVRGLQQIDADKKVQQPQKKLCISKEIMKLFVVKLHHFVVAVTFDGGSPIVKSILCPAGSDQKRNLEKIFNGSQFSAGPCLTIHNETLHFTKQKCKYIYITSPFVETSVFLSTHVLLHHFKFLQ